MSDTGAPETSLVGSRALREQDGVFLRRNPEFKMGTCDKVVPWNHLLTFMVSGLKTCVIRCLFESFWFHNFLVKFQIDTVSGESQRLIIVVLDALSVFSRVFRPPLDSADTSESTISQNLEKRTVRH